MSKQIISINKVHFSSDEEKAVLKTMRSGWVTQGPEIEKFEKNFANYVGSRFSVAVSNGTAALHLALLSLNLRKSDEVITTPFSFIASTNAILYVKAKPVFVDIGKDFNIDVSKIEEKITKNTKAILPVHLFGNPCNLDKILELANKYKLAVVEDACQAHGAEYNNKKVGTFGNLGCFSFYATKNMTTGEGGMIVTDDEKTYNFLKEARSHGSKRRYFHEFLGYNFRLTDIQAAIGNVQLKRLDDFNKKRIENAKYLSKELKDIKGLILPKEEVFKKHVYHQYTIIISKEFSLSRNQVMKYFDKHGVQTAIFYPIPIHKQKEIKELNLSYSMEVSEKLSNLVLSLPVHPFLVKRDLDRIIDIFHQIQKIKS
jgi:perosamine synthetase